MHPTALVCGTTKRVCKLCVEDINLMYQQTLNQWGFTLSSGSVNSSCLQTAIDGCQKMACLSYQLFGLLNDISWSFHRMGVISRHPIINSTDQLLPVEGGTKYQLHTTVSNIMLGRVTRHGEHHSECFGLNHWLDIHQTKTSLVCVYTLTMHVTGHTRIYKYS